MNRAPRSVSGSRSRSLLSLLSLWLLGVVPSAVGGCAQDPCLRPSLPPQELCKCRPKDDEILARLSSTELPYSVRKAVIRCADDIHRTDPHNVVTKQALRECAAQPGNGLDVMTVAALDQAIQRSNIMEQTKLDNWHAQCLGAGATPAAATGTAPAAAPGTTPAPSSAPATTPAPAAAPASSPAATPAPAGGTR
jgi:hypothetical protein